MGLTHARALAIASALLAMFTAMAVAELGPGPGPAPQGAPKQTPPAGGPAEFNLMVCNKTNGGTAFVAIGTRVPQQTGGEHPTRVQGWWQIPDGECTKLGTFPDPGFLIHARNARGQSQAFAKRPVFSLCVNLSDAFTSVLESMNELPKQCPAPQALIPFALLEVGQARNFTVTLNP